MANPLLRAVSACVVVAVVACAERSTSPPNQPAVGSVVMVPASASLEVGGQQAVYVNLRDQTGNPLQGRAVTWQSNATSVATVLAGVGGASATISAVAPGTAVISATSEGHAATATITVTAVPSADFAIVDAQWTQAVQQTDGAIPMILDGHGAVLNVALSSTAVSRAPGQLVLSLTDAAGAAVRSDTINPPAFSGLALYDQPIAQFLLPNASLRAGLRWRVRRDPRGLVSDADLTNDVFPRAGSAALVTATLPTMRIRFVPIVLSAHANATGNVAVGTLEGYLPTLRRTFPLGPYVATVGTSLVSAATFGTLPTGGGDAFWLQVLQDVDLARVADTSSRDTYWMGVVRPPPGFTFTSFGGFAYVPSQPASQARGTRTSTVVQTGWFSNTGQTPDLVAHELAHSLGRRHAPCGGATGVDPVFPMPNGTIGTVGHDVFSYANGLSSNASPRAATTGDLMGYCFPQWASPYTYAGLLAARIASAPSALRASSRTNTPSARQHVVVVRGRISRGVTSLLPTIAIAGFPTDGTVGAYRVELLDASARVLAMHRVDPVGVDHADDSTFTSAIALDEHTAESLHTVRVVGPSAILTTRGATASASLVAPSTRSPVAAVVARLGGRITATCQGPESAAIAVQDHATKSLLASASSDQVSIDARGVAAIDVYCSNGVRSRRSVNLKVPRR